MPDWNDPRALGLIPLEDGATAAVSVTADESTVYKFVKANDQGAFTGIYPDAPEIDRTIGGQMPVEAGRGHEGNDALLLRICTNCRAIIRGRRVEFLSLATMNEQAPHPRAFDRPASRNIHRLAPQSP